MDLTIIGGGLILISAAGLAIYAITNRTPQKPPRQAAVGNKPMPSPPPAPKSLESAFQRPPQEAPQEPKQEPEQEPKQEPVPAPPPQALRESQRPSPSTASSSGGSGKIAPRKPSPPRAHPPQVGTFKIVGLVGEGAMATVYRAEDQRNGQIVALKLVQAGLQKDPEFVKRFEREMEISKSLVHPNIVKVFESGEQDGQLYMAMELIEGDTLEVMVSGKPLPLFQVVRVAGQLVDGLHYAHQRDLIHRDIKPNNIMVTKNGIPKLLDFGLALQQGMNRFTSVGAAMGTPTHMAPESLTTGNSDKKSDQYSLGICIYQMLTGRCPFEGPEAMSIAMQHVKNPPPSIVAQREEVPLRLEQIVFRMLKKKPEERYPTLTQLQMEIVSAV